MNKVELIKQLESMRNNNRSFIGKDIQAIDQAIEIIKGNQVPSKEGFVNIAPAHHRELVAEVKYSDIPIQAQKRIIEIILNQAGGKQDER